jgi:hypothetical protein
MFVLTLRNPGYVPSAGHVSFVVKNTAQGRGVFPEDIERRSQLSCHQ